MTSSPDRRSVPLGQSHFDHLYGAERIARATGATLVGSCDTVRVMETQGVQPGQLMAEVVIPRHLFEVILRRIRRLGPLLPAPT